MDTFSALQAREALEYNHAMLQLCALTGVDYALMQERFAVWVQTQPLSWREGFKRCKFALAYGANLPFLEP